MPNRSGIRGLASNLHLPCLGDEIVAAETIVLFFLHTYESRLFIEMPRREEFALGPERDLAEARLTGEADTFGDEAFSDAVAAGEGLDVKQAQFGY